MWCTQTLTGTHIFIFIFLIDISIISSVPFILDFFYLTFMCIGVRMSDLELELQTVVSSHVGAGS